MVQKALEVSQRIGRDSDAKIIAQTWDNYNSQRHTKVAEWREVRNYIFATDTTTTTNRHLPWKNSTTLPKLCQIRDNLHSNYLSALFPNDDWLSWEAHTQDGAYKGKVRPIEAYMSNKTRESHFRTEVSKLVYDFIDYGNVFATVDFESSFKTEENGERTVRYIGPKVRRISPLDIVFNPIATSFKVL